MMDYFRLGTLMFFALCIHLVAPGCLDLPNGMCITQTEFLNWNDARENCTALGGTLASLAPNMAYELREAVNVTAVWIGGRTSRVWSKDNSPFYFGKWVGCVEYWNHSVNIREYTNVSECLQSCSLIQRALLNKTHCECTNSGGTDTNMGLEGCTDPFNWTRGPGNKTHVFLMRTKTETENRNGSESLTISNNLGVKFGISTSVQHALCQSSNDMSTTPTVPYGNTGTFLWVSNTSVDFDSAEDACNKSGGTLAKLDWESCSLNQELRDVLNDTKVWIGVSSMDWRFLDGTIVSSLWVNFTPSMDRNCLLWNQSDLVTAKCLQNGPGFPGLCEIPRETRFTPSEEAISTTQLPMLVAMDVSNSLSGVYIGVGVSAAILIVLAIVLIVIWRVRRTRSTDKPSSRHSQTEHVNETYAVTSPDQSPADMAANLPEVDTEISDANARDSFSYLHSKVNKTPINSTVGNGLGNSATSVDGQSPASDDVISFSEAPITNEYDHLNIPSVKSTRGVDTSSTYNHVVKDSVLGAGGEEESNADLS